MWSEKRNLDTTKETESSPKKRKRKKVRSRQKNICKDHRDVKPVHLRVVGQGMNYRGRPLTQETRAKLNLSSDASFVGCDVYAMPLAIEQTKLKGTDEGP